MSPGHIADDTPVLQVLALAGSLRRGSYNRLLLAEAAACAPAGIDVRVYTDLSSIPLFDEDLEGRGAPPAPVVHLRDAVASSRGLLISTPEYNRSIPGVLKNAIDWLSRSGELAGKSVAVMGATTGRWGTRLAQRELRHTLHAVGALVLPGPELFARDAESLFDGGGRLVDRSTRDDLTALLAAFARWIRSSETFAAGP